MKRPVQLETERLLLRQWTDADQAPFAAMCSDTKVMEFFPSTLNSDESYAMVGRCRVLIEERG